MVDQDHDPAAITVALTTYNRRDMLERAVRSVLDETRVPIRLQVHDNASTDGTEAYMRALAASDARVRYRRNPTNIGGHNNIIESLRGVNSGFYVPLADDDYLLPDFLFDAYAIMQQDGELGAVAFYAEVRDELGRVINHWPNNVHGMVEGKRHPADHLRNWLTTSHYSHQTVLWRAETLTYLGPPYFHTGMPSDLDVQAQIFAKFPVFVVKRAGGVFSYHGGQASHGLGVVDVMSWAKLFARLDKAVGTLDLFPADEYSRLRTVLWQRLQPGWRRASNVPLAIPTLARLAVSAGFGLGDWDLAFYLAAETRKRQAGEREALRQVPSGPGDEAPIPMRIEQGLRALELIHGGLQREQALSAQVNALAANTKTLQDAALAVAADRNRVATELAALRLQYDRLCDATAPLEPSNHLRAVGAAQASPVSAARPG